jgi:enoyl-[acyl-carrier protein] reductase I
VTGEVHFVDAGYNVIGVPPASLLKSWNTAENGDKEDAQT